MQARKKELENLSLFQQFIRLHPGSTFLTFFAGLPLIVPSIIAGYGLFDEFKRVFKPNKFKSESIFSNEEYFENNKLIAKLTHRNGFPSIDIYTSDPYLSAKAQAHLMAKHYSEFYLMYWRYLTKLPLLISGPWWGMPENYINQEVKRRQFDFSLIEEERHQILKHSNSHIAAYNKAKLLPFLRMPPITEKSFNAMLAMVDVYKKSFGCSAVVLNDSRINEKILLRNLDWPILDCAEYSIGTFKPTGHLDQDKPQWVFSLGLTPGILGISMCNDKGLVITLNEATKMHSKRENIQARAQPEVVLIRKVVENCVTIDDIKLFFQKNQPTTSHILTAMTKDGGGIFEMLPTGENQNEIFNFRPLKTINEDVQAVHATNFFLDNHDEAIPESGTAESILRYKNVGEKINEYVNSHQPGVSSIISCASRNMSIQSMIFNSSNEALTASINIANTHSPCAINSESKDVNYTELNLTEIFKELEASKINKTPLTNEEIEVDKSLVELSKFAHEIGATHLELAESLSDLYSALTIELSKNQIYKHCLSVSTIKTIVEETVATSKLIIQNMSDINIERLQSYSDLIDKLALQRKFNFNKLISELLVLTLSTVFVSFILNVSPVQLISFVWEKMVEAFINHPLKFISATALSSIAGNIAVDSFYKKDITFFANKVISNLQTQVDSPIVNTNESQLNSGKKLYS
jgi:hypothetical protein